MDRKDLDKNLDNIIIDALIKEAEQENLEFAYAMRNIDEKQFLSIIENNGFTYFKGYKIDSFLDCLGLACATEEADLSKLEPENPVKQEDSAKTKVEDIKEVVIEDNNKGQVVVYERCKETGSSIFRVVNFKKWLITAACAISIIILVTVQSFIYINAKLCDNALYISERYMSNVYDSQDIYKATNKQVKDILPILERNYEETFFIENGTLLCSDNFDESAWRLAIAYIKLHKRNKALHVLEIIDVETKNIDVRSNCNELIKQLK